MNVAPVARPGVAAMAVFALAAFGTHAQARPDTEVGGPVAPGTVWTAAGSPYVSTSDVQVPQGVELTIEPGAEVRLGYGHSIDVAGAVRAVGTEAEPIVITADDPSRRWNSVVFQESSGPSEVQYVHFSLNGASRSAAMMQILTDDVTVSDSDFEDSEAVAMDIRDASPNIERSFFRNAAAAAAQPMGALRIRGASAPVVRDNLFRSNQNAPMYLDANARPTFAGNRFEFNGWDGVFWSGNVERAVTLPSLGPRRWAYWVDSSGIRVRPEGVLTVAPGTTVAFRSNGINVEGTLRVEGAADGKVLFTSDSNDPRPGRWRDIVFAASSTPYDTATGEGSLINHTIMEYGGSQISGVITVQGASPRISNVLFRRSANRGVTVSGAGAAPILIGNTFEALTTENNGVGVHATGAATGTLAFNIFRDNLVGVEADDGAAPTIGPHNRFEYNQEWGVINRDDSHCIDAADNDWSDLAGPLDPSDREDTCGLGDNVSFGDTVSDNVGYVPWSGAVGRPLISSPRCGTTRDTGLLLEGYAPPGSQVVVYDNYAPIGEATAAPGSEVLTPFSFDVAGLAPGSHVFAVRAEEGDLSSGISDPVDIAVNPTLFIDPRGMHVTYDLDGIHYAQPLNDLTGCASLRAGEWEVRVHPDTQDPNVGARTTLHVPVACPSAASAVLLYRDERIDMTLSGETATATFDPGDGGGMELEVTCGATTSRVVLGTGNLEYNGFVYNGDSVLSEPALDRIEGATATLFASDGANWYQWDAEGTFGQENPQVTGPFGWYGWYPPPGMYRVDVKRDGYTDYRSDPVRITSQPFMVTVGLRMPPRLLLPALANRDE